MAESEENLLTGTGNSDQATQNWKETVPKDLRFSGEGNDRLGRFNEPSDVAKSYLELESSMGDKVKLPAEDAPANELSAFYDRLGRPQNPDGYEVIVPEGSIRDEDFENAMKKLAYDSGAPKKQFEALVKGYYDYMEAAIHRSREEGEQVLKEDWGTKYEPNLAISQRACRELGNDEFNELLQTSHMGNHPVFVKVFYDIGLKMLDDTLVKGDQTSGEKETYVPQYKDSPEMYATGDDDESVKAREYFKKKGYVY